MFGIHQYFFRLGRFLNLTGLLTVSNLNFLMISYACLVHAILVVPYPRIYTPFFQFHNILVLPLSGVSA